jgi:hypothetical protein
MNNPEEPDNHDMKGLSLSLLRVVVRNNADPRIKNAARTRIDERISDVDTLVDFARVSASDPEMMEIVLKAIERISDVNALVYLMRETLLPEQVGVAAGKRAVDITDDVHVLYDWARWDVYLPIFAREAAGSKAISLTDDVDTLSGWAQNPQSPFLERSLPDKTGERKDSGMLESMMEAAGSKAVKEAVKRKGYAALKRLSSSLSPASVQAEARAALEKLPNPLAEGGLLLPSKPEQKGKAPGKARETPAFSGIRKRIHSILRLF